MKITIAIDSFKGSIDTHTSAAAISEGIRRVYHDAAITVSPLADGGEGTVDAIVSASDGKLISANVTDPLGRTISARYGIVGQTAVIEMSAAAGITLISQDERNPLNTTTYGVGEMILDAIDRGCRNFVIGIGGSATNDGGTGMLSAIGVDFLDKNGKKIPLGAKGLQTLTEIRTDHLNHILRECSFRIACDVKNPLCGDNGCSVVYGPQKGADPGMIVSMDAWLKNYADLTKTINPSADSDYPGAGAAGGMGFAFMAYLGGELKSGVELVMTETDLEKHIIDSDIVITGEGRLDLQSHMGKAPIGVAKLAKKYGKAVIAFSGCVADGAHLCNEHGIDAFFPILRKPCTLSEAMDTANAYKNLADTAEQVFRLIKAIK